MKSIAVSGKGGAGKTALTAMMTKVIIGKGTPGKILLVDADPAGGLAPALGLSVEITIGNIREEIIRSVRKGGRKTKAQIAGAVDYKIMEALAELESFSFLAVGRTETDGCFCPVNDLLRDAIEILLKDFDLVIIDGEAGLEQINRKVMRSVDSLIIVTDPSHRGKRTAAGIKDIVETQRLMKSDQMALVMNRIKGAVGLGEEAAREVGLKLAGCIPEDENITRYDSMGKPLLELPEDSPGVVAVQGILENLRIN
ncbi:MAG: AAA family ATPase [Deltaproteobacteria bacterium]|nr:MAG: AAA family ATPase [Deltaproteobacteria bacterium]